MISKYFIAGCAFWGIILFVLFCIRPKGNLHSLTLETVNVKQKILIIIILLVTILGCILPMGQAEIWNGRTPAHEKQYEKMTESILQGKLYLDYGEIDPALVTMQNPYDTEARNILKVDYQFDHAFYDNQYYMYFGVVPVFLLFLPYHIITGVNLATCQATQLFTALFIIGIFIVFYVFAKRFFGKISLAMYLLFSVAVSVMSVWYSIGAPVLYCTAIMAALCMEIWSLYFFICAVWVKEGQRKTILYAFFGSLFGALAFGCRPSIALANLLVLPMLIVYLQNRKINFSLIMQLAFAALPYLIVGILLMLYNYVRFDNPFEFGQIYQLTIADLSNYGNVWERLDIGILVKSIYNNFFEWNPLEERFPYVIPSSVFVNYPILLFSIIGVCVKKVRMIIKENHLTFFMIALFLIPVVITVMDIMWTAYLVERYRMDIYWLMGILCFIVSGFYYVRLSEQGKRKFGYLMSVLALFSIFSSGLFMLSNRAVNISINWPGGMEAIQSVLRLGF